MLDDYPVDLGGAVPYSQCRLNHVRPNTHYSNHEGDIYELEGSFVFSTGNFI